MAKIVLPILLCWIISGVIFIIINAIWHIFDSLEELNAASWVAGGTLGIILYLIGENSEENNKKNNCALSSRFVFFICGFYLFLQLINKPICPQHGLMLARSMNCNFQWPKKQKQNTKRKEKEVRTLQCLSKYSEK